MTSVVRLGGRIFLKELFCRNGLAKSFSLIDRMFQFLFVTVIAAYMAAQ